MARAPQTTDRRRRVSVTAAVLLGVAVVATPTHVIAAPPASSEGVPKLRSVRVSGNGTDTRALVPALRVRRPDLDIESGSLATGRDTSQLSVDRGSDGLRLVLRHTDGNTYARDVPADDDIGTRAVASDVAAFLNAVERGSVEPEPKRARTRSSSDARRTPLADALQLGLAVGPSLTTPLADGDSARAGAYLAGDFIARLQIVHNVLFEFSVRGGGKRAAGHRLARGRIGIGGGYRLTRGNFDLPLTAALTIEPWSIRQRRDDAADLDTDMPLSGPPALVGLALRAAPAALLPLRNGMSVRIGGAFELATSAVPGAGGGALEVTPEQNDDPAFRVGGFGAAFMAEIGIWMPWTVLRGKARKRL